MKFIIASSFDAWTRRFFPSARATVNCLCAGGNFRLAVVPIFDKGQVAISCTADDISNCVVRRWSAPCRIHLEEEAR